MVIIDGRQIAHDIIARLKASVKPGKFLAAVLVGDDESSVSFLKQKEKVARELGVDFRLHTFPKDMKNDDLRDEVRKLADHKTCGGVIVQLPLPEHVNAQYILNAIPREKDIDVLGERALGAFYADRNPVIPPAVGVVQEALAAGHVSLAASSVAVVGVGPLVGKPVSMWLTRRVKELRLLHKGSDFGMLKDADVVIVGVGQAGLIKSAMLKHGGGVIDFGYDGGRGDLDPSGLEDGWYTPTPGGTGPILVAKLFENFYKLVSVKKEEAKP